MEPDSAPLLPELIDQTSEHCLAEILQATRLLLAEFAADITDKKSLHVLDLALLNAIDDLEPVDVPAQFIESDSRMTGEPFSKNRQKRLHATLRELEQNEDIHLKHIGIKHLKWLLSLISKKPQPPREQ
jgi:hypothetical protein